MKMIKILLLLGSLNTIALANNINIRVGGDLTTKTDSLGLYSNGNTEDYGYEIGVEYKKKVTQKLDLGLGIAYQKHSKISGNKSEFSSWNGSIQSEYSKGFDDFQGYDSFPIYLTGKYILTNSWVVKPYIKANLGYSFNFNNKSIKYSDGVTHENESTDTDLGGQVFNEYTLSTNIKNGLYYGTGIGLEYSSLSLEALYQVNEGELNIDNKDYTANYKKLSLILNYRF